MKKVLSSVFLGALLMIGNAVMAVGADADPVVGTWKLNLPKSTFGGVPAYKSQTRIYSRTSGDLTLKMTTVSNDGKENTTQATYKLNGQDYPSMGNPDFDESFRDADRYQHRRIHVETQPGKPVGKIRRKVSENGQTLTINFVLTNASGVQTSALTVFDKQ